MPNVVKGAIAASLSLELGRDPTKEEIDKAFEQYLLEDLQCWGGVGAPIVKIGPNKLVDWKIYKQGDY